MSPGDQHLSFSEFEGSESNVRYYCRTMPAVLSRAQCPRLR